MPLWRSRARMQRRMFVWFGVSILVTGFVVSLVINTVERVRGGTGRTEWHGVEQLLSAQASRVWSNPTERDAWAADLSHHLGWGVSIEDNDGQVLARFGSTGGRWTETVPVTQEGRSVGRVKIQAWGPTHGGWMVLLAVTVALAVLWAASGRIARRLAWPLEELTRVARDLGDGKLQSRFDLRHARGEVRSLAEVMNAMAARIERQLKDQRELLAAVSHELRTPLARIRLLLELGRNGDLQVLDPLEHEVLEMDALVGELLASARLDFSAMARVPLEATDLATRALERAALSSDLLAPKGGPPLPLEGDPTLLQRALSNLLENARVHGGGVSRLGVEADDGAVRFAVEDRGPGLGDRSVQLFQPFQRGERSDGLGLGLALVRRIAEAHGGRAFAENLAEGGARVGFTVRGTARGTRPP
jgi:two-component system, OmpR family, sensor kinase